MKTYRKLQNSVFLFGMRATTFLAVLTLMLVVISAEATANLLTNGDFEMGDLTGWTWTPTQYSEATMNPTVVTFETTIGQPSLCFRVNPGTDELHHGIGQEEGGILSQTINLAKGTEYAVSVGAAAMQNLHAENFDAGRIRLYIEGSLLWDWNIDDIDAYVTIRNSYSGTYVPAFTGLHDFELLFTRTYRNYSPVLYHYMDNASVIPEPTTVLLLALGSGAAIRKRRQ
jgi:hypothetical protein